MRESDVWKHASDAEFDNAMEGMEKLVMNRLYDLSVSSTSSYRFRMSHRYSQRFHTHACKSHPAETNNFRWFGTWSCIVSKDCPLRVDWRETSGCTSRRRQQGVPFVCSTRWVLWHSRWKHKCQYSSAVELLKINHYKAPRDKLICILNCCKVIFGVQLSLCHVINSQRAWTLTGLMRHLQREEGADSFVPILIFVVLKANPGHLLSNVEWVVTIFTASTSHNKICV